MPANRTSTPQPASMMQGRADAQSTRELAVRFASGFADDFYRDLCGLSVSSIGMGTYLGECDDAEDQRYERIINEGIKSGLNFIDTAINYRCQRSERAVGRAIRDVVAAGIARREEIVVSTKGGYIPLEKEPPATRDDYRKFLASEYFDPAIMSASNVVAGGHCLTPRFLSNQIERSRANLGLDCLDVFYIHNPEQQLDVLGRAEFQTVMRDAFAELEKNVTAGKIGVYGCATWNGFRVFPANKNYLSLEELVTAAIAAGGNDHHFKVVQVPVNLAMTEAVRLPSQHDGTTNHSLVEIARQLNISVVASAALMQSQLTHDLPPAARALFPTLDTDAQRAIGFVRSLPVTSALVGMRTSQHLDENLGAARAIVPTPSTPA